MSTTVTKTPPRRGAAVQAGTQTYADATSVEFLSVATFKEQVGANSISILRNPKTQKLFMATDGGQNYKVQGDIDTDSEMRVLIPDGDLDQACLVNVNTENMAETIATL